MESDRNSLSVSHATEIDRDLRPADGETVHAARARGYCHTLDRDRGREVNYHLISRPGAAFDSHVASKRQRNIKGAGAAVHLSRERTLRQPVLLWTVEQ